MEGKIYSPSRKFAERAKKEENKQTTLQRNQRGKIGVLARTQKQRDCSNMSPTVPPPKKKIKHDSNNRLQPSSCVCLSVRPRVWQSVCDKSVFCGNG